MDIQFTQFLRPNGKQKEVLINRPDEISNKALAVLKTGGRFTVEELMNGMVSLAYEKEIDGEMQDVEIELSSNGPKVSIAVDILIEKLYKRFVK